MAILLLFRAPSAEKVNFLVLHQGGMVIHLTLSLLKLTKLDIDILLLDMS